MKLKEGRLARVPDRRGQVLAVWEGKQAVEMVVEKANEKGVYSWLTYPWYSGGVGNLTVTFWVKMDATIKIDIYRHIVKTAHWVIAYNGMEKRIEAFIAFSGKPVGDATNNVACNVPDIGRWTHVALGKILIRLISYFAYTNLIF